MYYKHTAQNKIENHPFTHKHIKVKIKNYEVTNLSMFQSN